MSKAQVKEKVQRILAGSLGSVSIDEDGDFFVRFESAVVVVEVLEMNDDVTLIKSYSIMLSEVPLNHEVYRWVATEGQDHFFGHARVVERDNGTGTIMFEHVLLGDFLDPEELNWAVLALGRTADELDDRLQARFGGKRFIEG